MDIQVVPLAVLCSVGLTALAMSILAFFQTTSCARVLERRAREREGQLEAAVEATKETVEGLATEVHDIQQQTPIVPVSRAPRTTLNLSKRSQALRMHRRGDSPDRIAAVLEVPRQEIELLLKVHQIVIRNLVVTARSESLPGPVIPA